MKVNMRNGAFLPDSMVQRMRPVARGAQGPEGPKGETGEQGPKGEAATINGEPTITIAEGDNISITQEGTTLTISVKRPIYSEVSNPEGTTVIIGG